MLINKLAVRADASYVVNGDYHVPNMAGFVDQYAECKTWAAVHPELVQVEPEYIAAPPTIEDQLAAIEAKYEQKQAELDKALVAVLRMDGAQEAAARAAIKQKSLKLIQDQNDEIDALSAQQNGG